jgi:hypothetical protein
MILNWLGDGPVKSYSVDQQILSLYPLNSGKVLTIAPNGDIFKTRIEALSEPLKKSSLQIAGSDLRQIVYCDGILLLGVNSKGELVSMDMNGHGEKVFRLADYQIDNLLESF